VRDVVTLAALNAAYVALGLVVVRLVSLFRATHVIGRVTLAYLLGALGVGAVASYLALADVALPAWLVLLAGAAACAWLVRVRAGSHSAPSERQRLGRVEAVLLGAVLLAGAVLVIAAVARPMLKTDGWAIWGLKAHALFTEGGVGGAVFQGDAYARSHPDYPILMPALEALQSRAVGRFDPTVVDLTIALLAVSGAVAIWSLLRTRGVAWLAAAVALLCLGLPTMVNNVVWNYADAPLAYLVALGALCSAVYLAEGDRTAALVAGPFLAGAAMTKNEGLVLALIVVLAAAAVAAFAHVSVRPLALAALVVVGVSLPWRLWLVTHGVGNSDFRLSDPHVDRYEVALKHLVKELLTAWFPLTLIGVLGIALALLAGSRRLAAYVALLSALGVVALAGTYVVSVWPLNAHLATSSNRVVASIAVSLAAAAPLLLAGTWPAREAVTRAWRGRKQAR
jgi:hypothetical protein